MLWLAWNFFSFSIYFFSVGVCGVWVLVRLRCSLFIRFPLLCFYSIYLVAARTNQHQQILDYSAFSVLKVEQYSTVQYSTVQYSTVTSTVFWISNLSIFFLYRMESEGQKIVRSFIFPDTIGCNTRDGRYIYYNYTINCYITCNVIP